MNGMVFCEADRRILRLGAGGEDSAALLGCRLSPDVVECREASRYEFVERLCRSLNTGWLTGEGRREMSALGEGWWRGWPVGEGLRASLRSALRQAEAQKAHPMMAAGVHRLARSLADVEPESLTRLAARLPPELRRIFVSSRERLRRLPSVLRSAGRLRAKLEVENGRDGTDSAPGDG